MSQDAETPVSFEQAVQSHAAELKARPGYALLQAWQGMDLAATRRAFIAALQAAGIDEAEADARFLIAHVIAPHTLAQALADPALWSWQAAANLADLAARRLQRVPLSQVLGHQPFWTLDLKVTSDVLTPRADTETLVEVALTNFVDGGRVVDLGTGSGAILLAILSERPAASGIGIDSSEAALTVARENARLTELSERVEFRSGNWADDLPDDAYDLAVSNPPYIASEVLAGLEPEVRDHEPTQALDGGADGLDVYHLLIPELFRIVKPGGMAAVEIGFDQARAVTALFGVAGFGEVALSCDLAGQPRVVAGMKPKTVSR